MKFQFKPSDFKGCFSHGIYHVGNEETIAARANGLLQAYLDEHCPVVHGISGAGAWYEGVAHREFTHTARLFGIEPIKPCKHIGGIKGSPADPPGIGYCADCNAKLRRVEHWEVVK